MSTTTTEKTPPPGAGGHITLEPDRLRTLSTVGLFVLGVLYTAHVARPFLLPVIVAMLLSFVFNPIVRGLEAWRVPRWLGAALLVAALVVSASYGVARLFNPAAEWISNAPSRLGDLEERLRILFEPVEQVSAAAEQVGDLVDGGAAQRRESVRVESAPMSQIVLARAGTLVGGAAVTLALLYFLLVSGDLFLRKLVRVLPTLSARKRAVRVAQRIRTNLSTHLLTVTVINLLLGCIVGLAMAALGLPNPILWGVMAGVVNFVPYLGALVGTAVVGFVSLTSADSALAALIAPAVYLGITAIEGTFVTPAVLGRRMRLNAVAVFLSILLWGWIWGVPGALLAVPIVTSLKVFADAYPELSALNEFLGR